MKTLIRLYTVITIWTFKAYSVNGTLSISDSGSNTVGSTTYVLACSIAPYDNQASWERDGIVIGQCPVGSCDASTDTRYSFSNDAGTIYVHFLQLQANENGIIWKCKHAFEIPATFTVEVDSSPKSEMSTSMATERMTSINSISELSNTTLPMITGSTTTTSIETLNFDANTQNNSIQTNTLRIISNSVSTYQSMFVITTATDISGSFEINLQTMTETFTMTGYTLSSYNEIISPSTFETSIVFPQTVSETSISLSADTLSDSLIHTILVGSGSLIATNSSEFSMLFMTISPSYVGDLNITSFRTTFSVPSLTSGTTDSAFEITNVSRVSNFSLTTETVIAATVVSSAENTVLNSKKSASVLLIISENNSHIQQIATNTESPLFSTTFIDQISSKIEEPSFSSYQDLSETSMTLSKISINSQLSSSIIDTLDHFIYTTNTLITSYLDDTRHSLVDFTSSFQSSSLDYADSASTSLPYFIQSTYHHVSLQISEYNATIQTEFTSYVTTPFYESNTDNAATVIYSKEIVSSGKSYMHSSVMPSLTHLTSMHNIQDLTIDLQSTYFEPYYQSKDDYFSSSIYKYFLSTFQSTSLLLPFNTKANVSEVDSYMETTNMMTFDPQSGIQANNLTLLTNPSSIQIPAVSFDSTPTLLTTAINFNSDTLPSMIKPSSQRTNSDNSYNEIGTSFKDMSFFINSFSESVTTRELIMITLSSGVVGSISTLSTSTTQSGLSEKNKNIIFITTSSAVVTIIVVILLMIFAKLYMSKYNLKPPKEGDNISWSNYSSPPKEAFPDYSVTGKRIYPLLNTASTSIKMHPYEHNWDDIV